MKTHISTKLFLNVILLVFVILKTQFLKKLKFLSFFYHNFPSMFDRFFFSLNTIKYAVLKFQIMHIKHTFCKKKKSQKSFGS